MSDNYYQILGIPRDSDEREIKRAYHRIAREFHPDKAETPEQAKEMEQKFASASTAYNLLKDSEQRQEYDRKMFGGSQAPKKGSGEGAPPSSAPASGGPSEEEDDGRIAKPKVQVAAPAPEKKPSPTSSAAPEQGEVSSQRQAIAQKAYVKGVKLMREKEFAKAVEFFEAAINNNPNEASYYNRLATALIDAKKSANKAIEAGQKAIELDKFNLDYYFNLARIYETIGSKSKALEMYEEILRWDSDSESAKQMIRELKRKKGGLADKVGKVSPALGNLIRKLERD